MNNRPAVKILIPYLAGIILADQLNISLIFLWIVSAILLAVIVLAYKKRWLSSSSVMIGICFLLFGFMRYEVSMIPPKNFDKVLYKDVKVYGTVLDSQKERNGGSSILINGEAYLPSQPSIFMKGKISIRSWEDDTFPEVYGYGDIVGLEGRLSHPSPARNPGAFNYQKYLHRQGVFAIMTVEKVEDVQHLGIGANAFLRWIKGFRNRVDLVINEISRDDDTESILRGVILGEKNDMPVELYNAFRKTSTTHILVVSGVNFAILAGWVYGIFQLIKRILISFGVRNSILEKNFVSYIFILPIITIYAFMAGAEFSVIRAFIFILLFILANLLNRDSDLFNILAIAGLCILILSPGAFWHLGFLMSFVAVISIAYLMPYWDSLFSRFKNKRLIYISLQGIAVSISAQLGVGLIIVYSFGTYSFSGYIVNPLIASLVFLLTPVGFISCLAGLVYLPLGIIFGWIAYIIVWLLKSIVTFFAGFEFLYVSIKNFSLMQIIVAIAVIIFIANLPYLLRKKPLFAIILDSNTNPDMSNIHRLFKDNRIRLSENAKIIVTKVGKKWLVTDNPSNDWRDRRSAYLIKQDKNGINVYRENQTPLLACLVIISLSFFAWANLYEGNITKVTYLDVGEADSAVVDLPEDYEILIDGGVHRGKYSSGERVVFPFLNRQGIDDIELMVSTHPDNDHTGGLTYIVDNVKIDKAITGSYGMFSPTYKELINRLDSKGIEYYDAIPQTIYENRDTKVEILSNGYKEFLKDEESRMNNNSVVMKVTYKKASFLFTGDIEKEAERQLVNSGKDIRANVIKVPHHGSYSSSSNPFINAVQPDIAIISVGYRNYYNHPSNHVIRRYKSLGTSIYRTDYQGAVTIITDGRYGWIRTMKP
jgi:competence protein ComEC